MKQPNSTPSKLDRIVKPGEAAQWLGLSRSQFWRWRKAGKLPAGIVIDGQLVGYREASLVDWIERHTRVA